MEGLRTSVHCYPRRAVLASTGQKNELGHLLLCAILSRRSPSDVIHALASVPNENASAILYEALAALEIHSSTIDPTWKDEFLGVVIEMYRLVGLNSWCYTNTNCT